MAIRATASWATWVAAAAMISGCGGDGGGSDGGGGAAGSGAGGGGATPGNGVTWYRDVLPVARDNCMGCHSPGGAAPFSMVTDPDDVASYEQLAQYAGPIASEVEAGNMPPWMPSDDCNTYQHSRGLTPEQKQIFSDWADGGAQRGDPADAPGPMPTPEELPRVDATAAIAEPYMPTTLYGEDDLHCFVLDPALAEGRDIIGFNIKPGIAQVHHALIYKGDPSTTPGDDYECFGGPMGSGGVLGGWVPGMPPIEYPAGTGIHLEAGERIVMQIHYNFAVGMPDAPDQTAVELMFSEQPVAKPARIESIRDGSFVIPPYTKDASTRATLESPADITIWGLAPHMHTLGKRTSASVTRNGGDDACLIDIPSWDFNWQQFYFFDSANGVPVRRGETINVDCVWDNPNEYEVRWGEGTSDEMCITYFYVTVD